MQRLFLTFLILISVVVMGCSLLDESQMPGDAGVVTLRFDNEQLAAVAADDILKALAAALPNADSLRVCVYGPSGDAPEVCDARNLNPPTAMVEVELTVKAENNKRIAVELFNGGQLSFFGVNEDVDVVANQNTNVSITATSFEVGALWRVPGPATQLADGDPFSLHWNKASAATIYRFQESDKSDFSNITFELTLNDTILPGTLSPGDYFFRVRAESPYTQSEWQPLALHVYGPPVVTSIVSDEVLRGDVEVFTIDGEHLNYVQGRTVNVFGVEAAVLGSTPSRLTVQVIVPDNALTDVVKVANNLGSAASTEPIFVGNLVYIRDATGSSTADVISADAYKTAIDAFGASIANSHLFILPFEQLASYDFGLFDLVIIGRDTGEPTTSDWGNGAALFIDGSDTNVLGMGVGGLRYFGALGMEIGSLGNMVYSQQSEMYVPDPTNDIYTTPNNLGLAPDERVEMYDTAVDLFSIDGAAAGGPGLTAFSTYQPTTLVYPLVQEKNGGLDFLWGFHAPRGNMMPAANEIFENTVVYLFEDGTKGVLPNR